MTILELLQEHTVEVLQQTTQHASSHSINHHQGCLITFGAHGGFEVEQPCT